jgi:hypothetical protein
MAMGRKQDHDDGDRAVQIADSPLSLVGGTRAGRDLIFSQLKACTDSYSTLFNFEI